MFEIIKSSDKSSGTNGNCKIHLNDDLSGDFRLYLFSFYNNLYNVNDNNNVLVLTNTSDTVISNITLTNGDYSGDELATLITNGIADLNAIYDENTGKFTLSYTSDFKLNFVDNSNTCYKLLGFDNNTYTSTSSSLTSESVAELLPYKHLYLEINENDDKSLRDQSHNYYSLILNDKNSGFGSMFRYLCEDRVKQQRIHLKSSKQLNIKIKDENNNVCEIADWILILEK